MLIGVRSWSSKLSCSDRIDMPPSRDFVNIDFSCSNRFIRGLNEPTVVCAGLFTKFSLRSVNEVADEDFNVESCRDLDFRLLFFFGF